MNKTVKLFLLLLALANVAYAEDPAKDFTFVTVEGKTINYRASSGIPMVINIGSHW